ncbi:hypothetical protein F5Y09DRAFT_348109 [Xylaria sp. FL1042]|nr:hypothetical protein F5Y09DRAFT_348109 [Xylaria sp. FL1042]
MLSDKPLTLDPGVHFRYNKELDNWHIRRLRWRKACSWISVGSSHSSAFHSSDKSDDSSDDGDSDELPGIFDSEQIIATQAVTESDDAVEHIELVQSDISYGVASRIPADDFVVSRSQLCEQGTLRRGVPEFGANSCVPGIHKTETAAEDLFFGISEEETACHSNGQLELSRQRSLAGEAGSDSEIHNNPPGIGAPDDQSTILSAAKVGWVGPFTGVDGFDGFDVLNGVGDMDDMLDFFNVG